LYIHYHVTCSHPQSCGTECTLVHCSLYTGCICRLLTPRSLEYQSSTSKALQQIKWKEVIKELSGLQCTIHQPNPASAIRENNLSNRYDSRNSSSPSSRITTRSWCSQWKTAVLGTSKERREEGAGSSRLRYRVCHAKAKSCDVDDDTTSRVYTPPFSGACRLYTSIPQFHLTTPLR
jgi:hypothetical protein